jgi:hypothetical protein
VWSCLILVHFVCRFTCNCNGTGFEGSLCEYEINECLLNPCQDRGSCNNQVIGPESLVVCNENYSEYNMMHYVNRFSTIVQMCYWRYKYGLISLFIDHLSALAFRLAKPGWISVECFVLFSNLAKSWYFYKNINF